MSVIQSTSHDFIDLQKKTGDLITVSMAGVSLSMLGQLTLHS